MTDPLDEVARQLRDAIGDEFRAEAEAGEADAAIAAARARTIGDVAVDLAARGSQVRVEMAGRIVLGTAVGGASDVLLLRVRDTLVAVSLRTVHAVAEIAAPPRADDDIPVTSLMNWLYRSEGRPGIEIGLVGTSHTEPGLIEAVAVDHLVWRTSAGTQAVAIAAVAVVVSR